MIKVILIITLLVAWSGSFCFAQNEANNQGFILQNHSFGDLSISASPTIFFNTPNGVQLAGGLRLKFFMSKRISFDTDLVFGRDYIHGDRVL
jgi:hypothetical protein